MNKDLNSRKIIKILLTLVSVTFMTLTLPKNPTMGGRPPMDIRIKMVYSLLVTVAIWTRRNIFFPASEKTK